MTSWNDIAEAVEARAGGCWMHQSLQGATFHVEHIIPRSSGGSSELENLAWACPSCNLKKSNRVEAIDPISGASVALFNPRIHPWADHFAWNGYHIAGISAMRRALVAALDLNHERRIMIRQAEEAFGLFPPD